MQGKNSLLGDLMAAIWQALRWVFYVPRWLVLPFIIFYQKTISPDHGLIKGLFPHGYCRFSPSCSQYGYLAIKKYGVIVGGAKTIWRIARCNPWSEGGIDLP